MADEMSSHRIRRARRSSERAGGKLDKEQPGHRDRTAGVTEKQVRDLLTKEPQDVGAQ